jgi:hypothetical protein
MMWPLRALLMIECRRRCLGTADVPPRHLTLAAGMDAGYCIDAPDWIPAGSCYQDDFEGEIFPSRVTVKREEESWS